MFSGTHHKGSNCDPKEQVDKLKNVFLEKQKQFYPDNLVLNGINTGIHKITKSNGGWSDPRDHYLCKSFFENKSPNNYTTITLIL